MAVVGDDQLGAEHSGVAGVGPSEAPPAHWFFGHLRDMKRDLLGFFSHCERNFGPVVPLKLYWVPFYLVNDPAVIQRVLFAEQSKFVKPTAFQAVKPMFGDGLLTSEGKFWQGQRALIQPLFHKQSIDRYAGVVVNSTASMMEAWDRDGSRDAYEDLSELALDIVLRSLFSGADIADGRSAVLGAARGVQDFFISWRKHYLPVAPWLPLPAQNKLRRAVEDVDRVIYKLIDARLASGERGQDMMSLLLDAGGNADAKMSRRAVRDELVTMFLAGHETSAVAMSWGLYELARDPRVTAKLRLELEGALGDRSPTLEDLPRLPYLDQVVKEVMRLYPSAYNIGRVATENVKVGDYTVRPGENVIMCQWAVHRSHRHYDNPEAFWPERWETERARKMPKFAYFPFSGGPRNCIGAQFALLEAKLILSTLVQRYDVAIEPGSNPTIDAALTLRPAAGMRVNVQRRLMALAS
jgi:cytochrome P450